MADISAGLSGAASGAAIGSAVPVIGTAIGAVVGGLAGLFGGGSKTSYKPVDISRVIADARTNAAENLKNSISLEQQYLPRTAELRVSTDRALQDMISGHTPGTVARDSLLSQLGQSKVNVDGLGSGSSNPLLEAATSRVMARLGLGGRLDADTQNAVTRGALAGAGTSGIAGSGAARGLVARDLGLTSLQLENQRTNDASALGATRANLSLQGDQLRLAGQNLTLQDFLGRLSAAGTAAGQDNQRAGLLASIIDGRSLPQSGLSPDAIASLQVGNSNAQSQYNLLGSAVKQQNSNSLLQSLLGFGGQAKAAGNTGGTALLDLLKGIGGSKGEAEAPPY